MKVLASLAGGLAGAITVTVLHEMFRKSDSSAPRLDKLGETATQKLAQPPERPATFQRPVGDCDTSTDVPRSIAVFKYTVAREMAICRLSVPAVRGRTRESR